MYPDLTAKQAAELVVSSMICGGVAMIYPFFGMAVVSTVAAIIPLLGPALLVSSQSSYRIFMLTGTTAAVLGLLAAAFAYRVIVRTWLRMGEVFSTTSSVVPGES